MIRGAILGADGRVARAWQWIGEEPCPFDISVEPGQRIVDCTMIAPEVIAWWASDAYGADAEHHPATAPEALARDFWDRFVAIPRDADDLAAILPFGLNAETVPADLAPEGLHLQPGYRRLVRQPAMPTVGLLTVDHEDGEHETVRSFPRHEVVHVLDGGDPENGGPGAPRPGARAAPGQAGLRRGDAAGAGGPAMTAMAHAARAMGDGPAASGELAGPRPLRSRVGDGPTVLVLDGDLEGALKELRKRLDRVGMRAVLRRHHAAQSRGERRRYKHARALRLATRRDRRVARAVAR